jgi:hypothetical protein
MDDDTYQKMRASAEEHVQRAEQEIVDLARDFVRRGQAAQAAVNKLTTPKDSMDKIRLKGGPKQYKRGPGLTGRARLQRRLDLMVMAATKMARKAADPDDAVWAAHVAAVVHTLCSASTATAATAKTRLADDIVLQVQRRYADREVPTKGSTTVYADAAMVRAVLAEGV